MSIEHVFDLEWRGEEAGGGPYHGDRVPAPMAAAVYQPLVAREGVGRVTARMTAVLRSALRQPCARH
jgi:hypothetical protein